MIKIKKNIFKYVYVLFLFIVLCLIIIAVWGSIIEKKELDKIYSAGDINFIIKNKQTGNVVCEGNLFLFEYLKVIRWNNLILCPIQDKKELAKGNLYKVYDFDSKTESIIQLKNVNVNSLYVTRIINNNLFLVVSQQNKSSQMLYFTKLPSDGNLKNIAFPTKKTGSDGTEIWFWDDFDFIFKGGEGDDGWNAGIYKFEDSNEKLKYLRDVSGGSFGGDLLLGKTSDNKILFSNHKRLDGNAEYQNLFLTDLDITSQPEIILSEDKMPQKVTDIDYLEKSNTVLLKGIDFIYPFDIKRRIVGQKIEIPKGWIEDGFSKWYVKKKDTSFCLYDRRNRAKNIKGQDILVKLPLIDVKKYTDCSDPIINQYKEWKNKFSKIEKSLDLPNNYKIEFTYLLKN